MSKILVLYYSHKGATKELAQFIAKGIESVDSAEAVVCTLPKVSTVCEKTEDDIPDQGHRYVTKQDLSECSGLILGSPTRFGNMAAPVKYFLDGTANEWVNGTLVNKPAAVFTSVSSMHGGHESTLLSMSLPLLHHGMILVGLPFTEPALNNTTSGGSPYGVTHYAGPNSTNKISDDEKILCGVLGKRVAEIATKLG